MISYRQIKYISSVGCTIGTEEIESNYECCFTLQIDPKINQTILRFNIMKKKKYLNDTYRYSTFF